MALAQVSVTYWSIFYWVNLNLLLHDWTEFAAASWLDRICCCCFMIGFNFLLLQGWTESAASWLDRTLYLLVGLSLLLLQDWIEFAVDSWIYILNQKTPFLQCKCKCSCFHIVQITPYYQSNVTIIFHSLHQLIRFVSWLVVTMIYGTF